MPINMFPISFDAKNGSFLHVVVAQLASIIGGANIHIFVFTDLKNNRFRKKVMMQNTIFEYSPLQLSTLVTPLACGVLHYG